MNSKMSCKKILIFMFVLMFSASLTACGSDEEKARAMYNDALSTQRSGNEEKAKKIYSKIVKKYPSTVIAVEVNELLARKEIISEHFDEKSKELWKETLITALQSYQLDNACFPSTEQGLYALIKKPTTGRMPPKWRAGGYLQAADIIDKVAEYTNVNNEFNIIMK